jgi:hypothetical protein
MFGSDRGVTSSCRQRLGDAEGRRERETASNQQDSNRAAHRRKRNEFISRAAAQTLQ